MKHKIRNFLLQNKEVIFIFSAAFIIRLFFWNWLGSLFNAYNADTIEYYITSFNFEPHTFFKSMWSYEHWYQRTPLYVIFLHLINRELIIQIIISSIGCALMYKLNKLAGVLWVIYLQDIIYSFNYNKECLLLFCIILSIFLLRNHRMWLVVVIPIILSGFVSYGGVVTSTHTYSHGAMLNFWKLWQPSFNISIGYSKLFVYIQAIPYIVSMIYFIRYVKILSMEAMVFIFLSILYSSIYAEPRYRELFMPLLFLYIAEPFKLFVTKIYKVKIKEIINRIKLKIHDVTILPKYSNVLRPISLSFLVILIKTLFSRI